MASLRQRNAHASHPEDHDDELSPMQSVAPLKHGKGSAVGALCAVVRAVGTWSYVLTTLIVLWALMPLMLLNPILRRLGVRESAMPVEAARMRWTRLALFIGGVSIEQQHHPKALEEPATILLPNHSSTLDAFTVGAYPPQAPTYIFKRELVWQFPYLFLLGWLMGSVPIDRSNREKSIKAINEVAPKVLRRRRGLVIFPEGTRSKSGRLLPFKKGAFHIAMREKCSITPIVLLGTYDLWPQKHWFPVPGYVVLKSLEPIKVRDGETVEQLLDRTRAEFVKAIKEAKHVTRTKSTLVGTAPACIWLAFLFAFVYFFAWPLLF